MKNAFTIWTTGLNFSGKTRVAGFLRDFFIEQDIKIQILDENYIRSEMGIVFGNTKSERIKVDNLLREFSIILNENEINTIVTSVSPYQSVREKNRQKISKYYEIFIKSTLENCKKRDADNKLYQNVNIRFPNLVGFDDLYEYPVNYDYIIDNDDLSLEELKGKVKEISDRIISMEEKHVNTY